MHFSASAALAAFLFTGDVFVHAACPSRSHRHQHTSSPSSAAASFPPSSSLSSSSSSSSAAEAVTFTTSTVPVASPTSTSTSSAVVVVTTTPSSTTTSATAVQKTSAASSSDAGLTSDEQAALDTQNSARADVGAAALAWDATLASDAQTWADHLAAQNSPGTLVHSGDSGEGENLYWQSNSGSPFASAADAWVAEKSSYDGEAIEDTAAFESYGHYTQIIWNSTTNVGMAIASDGQGGFYVVARYSPAGNIIGETPSS